MSFFTKIRDAVETVTVAPLAQVPGASNLVSKNAAPLVQQIGAVENIAAPFVVGAVLGPPAGEAAAKGIALLNSRAPVQQTFADVNLPLIHTERLRNPSTQAAYTARAGAASNTPLIVCGSLAAIAALLALA